MCDRCFWAIKIGLKNFNGGKASLTYSMEFEFDESKSQSNQEKHSIDFVEAQRVWADPDRIEIPARTEDEPRYLVIGRISQKHWSVVITYRNGKIRIISVRRSRVEEVKIYESNRA